MIDEVIFLRHGRTGFNLQRRLQGQIDIPLDIVGQWQVDQSAYSLAQRFYWAKVSNIAAHPDLLPHSADPSVRRMDVDEYRKAPASGRTMRVVSSDLFRAQQTAHAFADILGLDVHLDARLRERSFGQWEGMTREEIRERFPEGFRSWTAHTGGELDYGVESRADLGARGAATIADYVRHAQDPTPTTLFVVSHGSWIAATIGTLLDMDMDNLNTLDGIRNAFWSTMGVSADATGTHWVLTEFNQGPAIAAAGDWENGPAALRNPDMGVWKPVKGAKA
ncbi:phosphoglycerate mutase [Bifidobacterium pseudolongum subsp. globosum]|uniref:histidine phosphatase family protein n=1 Tax=Bifidobacterium pseudolongum TaxID=1694 RepID=UPI0010226D19|nr:histidine phosphatase family protein [Bifidobacterium pseudolongum]RYQ43805.1 phosphoglycerate mutase [Bifidobacterium pseudolongum subsp. globosum]